MKFYIYDLETFVSCFLFNGKFEDDSRVQTFEISSRRNDRDQLLQWLSYLQNSQALMVGYNSLSFDYPIVHELLTMPYTFDASKAHLLGTQIISAGNYGQNPNSIRFQDRIIPQLDLVKVNHFDNANRRVSLKSLQVAMRLDSVEDLPYNPNVDLSSEQMDNLIQYGIHDVMATEAFLKKCKPMIRMRQELLENGVLSGDVLNYSDVKIGTEYLIRKIGRQKCFLSGSKPRQTIRASIPFSTVILPKIQYRTESFRQILEWFKNQTIWVGGETRPSLKTPLAGLQFHFGVGGVHASVESKVFETNDTHVIKDIDVSGMYPAVATVNDFAPEHLGQDFVAAYKQLSIDRKQHPKGSTMNLLLKLANNGVFGNSNNPFSCFYDPKFTYSITINGQLQLLQLVELLSLIPGVELIQANTDGITAYVPRTVENFFDLWCNDWEAQTGLKLEHVPYRKMWIRDVNNYLAIDMKGNIKRKGAYWYPRKDDDYQGSSGSNWNKDFSMMVVQKATEQVLVHGHRVEDVIRLFSDPFDFLLRYKTPAGAKLFIGDKEQLKTVRYYVSTKGEPMKKIATPKGEIGHYKRKNGISDETYRTVLSQIPQGVWDERIHTKNKSKYAAVVTSIESGKLVKECNHIRNFSWRDVDYDYYINEIKKLLIGVQT